MEITKSNVIEAILLLQYNQEKTTAFAICEYLAEGKPLTDEEWKVFYHRVRATVEYLKKIGKVSHNEDDHTYKL